MLNENFLALYNEELRYLREDGQQFAAAHPQVAHHLGMMADGVLDPFVERLLEGTAFLSARVQSRLNHEQPEFALQMLGRLAPYWYTPLPSIATIAMTPDLTSPQWHANVTLARASKVLLHDASMHNRHATFTTARTLNIQPLVIEHAECASAPPVHLPQLAASCLQEGQAHIALRLSTQGVVSLAELDFAPLHLTLAGDIVHANQLLTTLLNDTSRIVLWAVGDDGKPVVRALSADALRQGGLSTQEALLPCATGELPGGRLLREYFAAPSRFFCLELHEINNFLRAASRAHTFEVVFVLRHRPLHLVGQVSEQDFRLFATPVINLSRRRCSPVPVSGEHTEYPVIVDRLNPRAWEIHHLLSVNGLLTEGGEIPFSPLSGHAGFDDAQRWAGYSLRRRREFIGRHDGATAPLPQDSLFISLSPGSQGTDIDRVKALSIEAMVCDRFLNPGQLQQPRFQLESALPVRQIETLRHPSRPQGVPDIAQAWKLLQLLASNPLRHAKPEVADCSALIRDWLSLFCLPQEASQYKRVTSLSHASIEHNFERSSLAGPIAWIRGVAATVDIRNSHHSDKGAFLFARLLHHALAEYCELGQTLRMNVLLDGEPFASWGPV